MEIGGGGGVVVAGGGGGGGGIDPSNLHLKKELTQIRKAARVLKDPGTSSSWRSPINSARSLTKHHYVHHHKNGLFDGNNPIPSSNTNNIHTNGNGSSDKANVNVKEKDKKVFLYNWRSHKSESERSKQIGDDDVENFKDEGSVSTRDESVDVDSLSDARNHGNDSKSDTYLSDLYASAMFKCKNTEFTPSIRRTIKKKTKRSSSNYSNASLARKQIISSRFAKKSGDQSDDTEDYCNSEDLRRASAISPLLARFKNKGFGSITCSTPALSTSSYNNTNKYGIRKKNASSIVESWDGTIGSFNDADDEVDDNLDFPGQKGCGIPCYWSKRSTPKSRGYGSSCSPSLSVFCGSQHYRKKRMSSSIPLLKNNRGGSSSSDDEISTNFDELDLESLSRLDGKRWSSSCRSREGLELVVQAHEESSPENSHSNSNSRTLSHKYRPMFFEEIIGQNIVVQSLVSSISRKRVGPVYLFQGPRGTGKTSVARIFGAALSCLAKTEDNNDNNNTKPCGVCRECADFMSGKNKNVLEIDGSDKKGIEKIKNILKNGSSSLFSRFNVFVVDECHLLPSKTWLAFLRLLEKPLPNVVFILVTTDSIDNVPRAILSRCQKHVFNKISSGDIVSRLRKIVSDENLDVELDALEMIASNADGSLRDAETMIDQLSLFGKRITISLVNELIGVVSDDKLLELLEIAMSSNATETVIRARELMDSGVDPIVLMSQMATLIVDIIAGTYPSVDAKHDPLLHDPLFGGRSLSERELDRLKHALTLLSESEKHLRVSSERSTWFTATLLQLGSMPSPDRTHSGSSRRQSSKAATEDHDHMIMLRKEGQLAREKSGSPKSLPRASLDSNPNNNNQSQGLRWMNSKMLVDIWIQCIEKCHSKTLRQLLHSYGRLVSISEVKGGFVAHIAFGDQSIKTRAEGFLSSITNSFEIVLRQNVEVKIIMLPDSNQTDRNIPENKSTRSINSNSKESEKSGIIPVQRIESIIRDHRLETAWLQTTMEKGGKPERNQVLPQDGGAYSSSANELDLEPMNFTDLPLQQQWEDEFNLEIKALKINDVGPPVQRDQITKRAEHYPISPSLLHNSSFASNFSKDNMGYESGSGAGGCSGMFCWNNTRPPRRGKKAKQGTPIRARKSGRFSWFGECAKSRSRYNR